MDDGIGHAETTLGLDGLKILDIEDRPGELVVTAETTRRVVYCPPCRKLANRHHRPLVGSEQDNMKAVRMIVDEHRRRLDDTRRPVNSTFVA
ncbi:MAG: hypothetical protein M0Z95_18810 [Actinomycetota bacterium]|jgi:hypothetical protein|nr:hypothetical protein [Actinomycetota bacterium]